MYCRRRFIMSPLLYPAIGQVQSNKWKTVPNEDSYDPFVHSFLPCSVWTGVILCQYILPHTSSQRWDCVCPIQNQTKSFVLLLVNIPCYLVQRGIRFDADTLLVMCKKNPKKPNISWSPRRAVQEVCQGVGSTIQKCFRNICCHHPRNSVFDLICDGTSEMNFRIYNYLKKILSLTELVLWLLDLIDSLFHLTYV